MCHVLDCSFMAAKKRWRVRNCFGVFGCASFFFFTKSPLIIYRVMQSTGTSPDFYHRLAEISRRKNRIKWSMQKENRLGHVTCSWL